MIYNEAINKVSALSGHSRKDRAIKRDNQLMYYIVTIRGILDEDVNWAQGQTQHMKVRILEHFL